MSVCVMVKSFLSTIQLLTPAEYITAHHQCGSLQPAWMLASTLWMQNCFVEMNPKTKNTPATDRQNCTTSYRSAIFALKSRDNIIIIRAVEALIFLRINALYWFSNALINALLTHPGPSRGRVGRWVTPGPATFGGLACRIWKIRNTF